jgi:hypothetical protein
MSNQDNLCPNSNHSIIIGEGFSIKEIFASSTSFEKPSHSLLKKELTQKIH